MRLVERLTDDHRKLMEDMDRLYALSERLNPRALPAFIAEMWAFVSSVEEHEEFEEESILTPLASGVVESEVVSGVNGIRGEHNAIFDRLAAVHARLSACRGLSAAEWTEAKAKELRDLIGTVFEELREHIRRENIGLFFLAAGRMDAEGGKPARKRPPAKSRR